MKIVFDVNYQQASCDGALICVYLIKNENENEMREFDQGREGLICVPNQSKKKKILFSLNEIVIDENPTSNWKKPCY